MALLTMGHPKVVPVFYKWLQYSNYRSCNLTFPELLEQVQSDLPMRTIARQAGITPAAMDDCYNRYFYGLLGMSSRKRWQEICRHRRERMLARTLPKNKHVREIIRLAQKQGYAVKPVLRDTGVYEKQLYIAEKHTLIRVLTNANQLSKKSTREYTYTHLLREKINKETAVILYTIIPGHPKRVFIFPGRFLLKHLFKKESDTIGRIYIPTERHTSFESWRVGAAPRFDVWKFENTWKETFGTTTS